MTILPIIFAFLGIGYTIIGSVNSYVLILFGLAIAGLGLGLLMPNMNVWLSASVPDAFCTKDYDRTSPTFSWGFVLWV